MKDSLEILDILVGTGRRHGYQDENNSNWSTLDVYTKNCVLDYDTVACLRGTLFCFLCTVTGLLCAGRIINLHLNGHPNYYQYVIFYLALIQCLLGTAEWVVGWKLHVSLAIVYLHILQALLVAHFYLKLALRVKLNLDLFYDKFTIAASTLFLFYFTSFFVFGLLFTSVSWMDCYANYWLFLSVGQLIVVQFMFLAGLLLISKVNSISAQESLKRMQKRGLLLLIVSFQLSAIVNVSYHFALFFLANEDGGGCSGVFMHKQLIYTPVRILFKISVELLPIWAMIYVFKPLQRTYPDQQALNISTTNASDGALSDPSIVPNAIIRGWRRRRMVGYGNARTLLPGSSVPYGRLVQIPRRRPKRCISLPSSLRKLRSPTLATIPEERSGHNSNRSSADECSPPTVDSVNISSTREISLSGALDNHENVRSL